ncbi:hypothetical protein RND71_023013 [Anisodus tanguticus]|uniref:Major pollen allergen Ole e 6-like n=1 Tax=Anisodus tanguticus TaxID=243964 RepID=A0AAE1RT48_9SOLA|nr:hypothetical protein RND71_023013 [Anisodus tanguticus]
MEAKKLVTMFLMCMVVFSAVHVSKAEFQGCYEDCQKECAEKGHGPTFCELKCDTDCGYMEIQESFQKLKP